MSVETLAATVAARYADVLTARGEATLVVDRDELLEALAWLRDEPTLRFGFLSCITATHWPGREPAFWVDYELRSMTLHHRLRVKVGLRRRRRHGAVGDAAVPDGELAGARDVRLLRDRVRRAIRI